MNLKYTKNMEGEFGFYMDGGLVKPEYVAHCFSSFIYRVEYLDKQITYLKKQLKESIDLHREGLEESISIDRDTIYIDKVVNHIKSCLSTLGEG